mmetsp:Transcript_12237/g.22642  ORF Transcript_12237/g.22642 Transcript_12237/m.22642 type:complete len:404 (-) Transcript_12237:46-1257(-)
MQTRFYGILKRFDPEKGYGFVSCPEVHAKYNRDTFIHRSEVIQAGLDVGHPLSFEVKLNTQGQPQAEEVLAESPQHEAVENLVQSSEGQRFVGKVKSYDFLQGYGFIACPDVHERYGRDTFLHRREVENSGCRIGDQVSFSVVIKAGKPQAQMVVKGDAEAPLDDQVEEAGHSDAPAEREVCMHFSKDGTCMFGDRCRFRHEVVASPSRARGSGRLRGACPYFLSGNCRMGLDCKKRHPEEEEAAEIRAELAAIPCHEGIHCKFWNCLYNHNIGASADDELREQQSAPEDKSGPDHTLDVERRSDQESFDGVVREVNAIDLGQQLPDWQRYHTDEGMLWWWCQATQEWFTENDCQGKDGLTWQTFLVPGTEEAYWWLSDDHWFWVSSDGESGTWGSPPPNGGS